MGGSGGGYFSSQSPESIRDALRKEEQATEDQLFDTQVANDIALLLGEYNNRDTEGTRRTLDRLKKALEKDIDEGSVTPIFGGSVRKHTYVDGISDIDCLFVLKGEEFAGITPGAALGILESKVEQVTPEAKVDRDKMSLRINEKTGVLEILPAIRSEGKLCVPTEDGTEWSKIDPQAFIRKLTETNDRLGGKVVPTIKVAKGINETFPQDQRLSGYHLESLAIEAFKDYDGPRNTKAMLEHLIGFAADRVLAPIRDKTGQSVHVDEYAGPKGSEIRKLIAQNLDRVRRRMKNANATRSREKWEDLLS